MLVVNPNICIDHTIELPELLPGHVQRPRTGVDTLGGKGVNVARVARRYGERPIVLTFLPRDDRARLLHLARLEDADLQGVEVDGTARGATIVLEDSGRVTVLNEPGALVDDLLWRTLLVRIRELGATERTVVCSGSLPPGSPPDAYARVVELSHVMGLTCVVDSAGDVLARALAAGADVISPNLAEAEALLGQSHPEGVDPTGPDVESRAGAAVRELRARGARHVIVSAGSHGAAYDVGDEVGWSSAPLVRVVNPIGAGDSLVGGLVRAMEVGVTWEDSVRIALATASASCEDPLAGGVDPARVDELVAALEPARRLSMGEAVSR